MVESFMLHTPITANNDTKFHFGIIISFFINHSLDKGHFPPLCYAYMAVIESWDGYISPMSHSVH